MEPNFWLERWQENQIGFHQNQVTAHLSEYWPRLGLKAGARVLVPLCGKSLDMLWLLSQGLEVIGVELSPLAASQFFAENRLVFTTSNQENFTQYHFDQLTLMVGDFFALTKAQAGRIDAVFERASLIALPPTMRPAYAKHMETLCPQAKHLLVTMEYDTTQMSGPPFSVGQKEVEALYPGLIPLGRVDTLDSYSQFKARGLTHLAERIYGRL
ncbi:MAG: hypothetical protein A2527_04915 [Candidatus Lambdaproteobacteria bacterium RIFOXYD2_FULL_50_16]|uniref:Thiopurine S-methyltransferase n=1 Tax=Candidatus Lambdaproteobacteria bacterium RIFOXYD2_FULL_50_16 TaxID=1817772 RepID=A0A1F6GBH0_9PROT|nr:MAG: hypothetical protein A2527_04915 [Candidatus Lambdaproteobacteria bacterium RIFOXYD2_FULL_50_16]